MLPLRELKISLLKVSTRTIMTNRWMYAVLEVLECIKCKVSTTAAIETEDGPGNAKISSWMQIPIVLSLIMLTILTSLCTSCVAVISTLLEYTATMITGVKIEGGGSHAALRKDSKSMAAGWRDMPMTFTLTWTFKQVLMRLSPVLMAIIAMTGSKCTQLVTPL